MTSRTPLSAALGTRAAPDTAGAPDRRGDDVRRWPSRKERIVLGASEMFAEHGYDGASIRAIARHLEISHPGVLHYFATKEALLSAALDRLEGRARQALEDVPVIGASRRSLSAGLRTHWDPSSPEMRLMASLDAGITSRHHPERFRVARLRRVHEHMLETCVTSFQSREELREGVDPAFVGRAVLALVLNYSVRETTVRAMQEQDHGDSPLGELDALVDLVLVD